MKGIFALTWRDDKHILCEFDRINGDLSFKRYVPSLADTIVNEMHKLINGRILNLDKVGYVAISYNKKSFTDLRIYYSIACSLAQIRGVKIVDVTWEDRKSGNIENVIIEKKNPQEIKNNTTFYKKENEEIDEGIFLHEIFRNVTEKINKNEFVDPFDLKPFYYNSTVFKKISQQNNYFKKIHNKRIRWKKNVSAEKI